ncbi:uncharacterized protein FOMMEDRAFT_139624 [Fomitiporia mediterranea MF3/22]|uniref:uncharacterized protein n=1 Tax=Fomitiporia mediterranea (strain MF3/22) TaxID=694068 RepID=UPI0004408541|nr:uncharacterized protein FOMMEDRAFT_139624 [Fomitiporia mediterranea MF3/22]EJD05010.1 hypothetical protein FOMMEDRAFT_139624 [Fomitiporia mediterranea MF3/22]
MANLRNLLNRVSARWTRNCRRNNAPVDTASQQNRACHTRVALSAFFLDPSRPVIT